MSNNQQTGPFRGYYLYDFERNGYDDSDFIVVWYDAVADRIEQGTYNTTRFAGGSSIPDYLREHGAAPMDAEWPEQVRERFADYVERRTRAWLRESRFVTPRPEKGQRAVFVESYRPRKRKPDREGVMTPDAEVGDAGTVIWRGRDQYRTVYPNGYQTYHANTHDRIGIALDKGGTVFVAVTKVAAEGAEVDLGEIGKRARGARRYALENPRAAGRGMHRAPRGFINAVA